MLRSCLLAVSLSLLSALSGCGGSSSAAPASVTAPPPATASANPTPAITSITPASLLAGSPSQSLTVTGSGFIASTVAQLNGTALETTYQSATSVTAVVPASAIAADGTEKITVSNPTPGGGSSPAQNYTIAVPTPGILAISPQAVVQGAATLIALSGTGFEANSVGQWNGAARTTTFTDSTSLQMALTAEDVQNFGMGQISIVNPGLAAAAPIPLYVRPHTPSIASFNPASVAAYTGSNLPRQIVITGNGFATGATVQANGQPVPVLGQTFSSITVSIPAGYFAAAGSISIVVSIPSVPPVSSAPAMLMVTAPQAPAPATTWMRELNYVPNDIAWDAVHGKLLASMPSTDATNPNTLLVIDPVAGTVSATVPTGHNPNLLSISAGASYLWVGLDGDSTVQRYLLPGLQKDVSIAIPKNQFGDAQSAVSLEAARVNPHLMAMVPGQWGGNGDGVVVYDDAVARPNTVPGFGNGTSLELDWIQWGQQDTTLYGTQYGTSDALGGVIPMNVDASGVSLGTRSDGQLAGGGLLAAGLYTYYNPGTGLIYADALVADPLLFTQVGQFSIDTGYYGCVGDQSVGRYFCLTPTQLLVFDLYHYQLLERVNLPSQIAQGFGRMVRWGTSGLAVISQKSLFDGTGGGLFLIDGTAINPKAAPDVTAGTAVTLYPSLTSLTPQQAPLGSSDVTVTLNGANFTPSSAVCLNCDKLQPQTLSTTYVSPTQLITTIPAAQLQTAGSLSVTVYDQQSTFFTPGSLQFTVLPAATSTNVQALNLSGLAMAWDATRSLLYVGVADYDGVYPNGIVSLDPSTATVTTVPVVGLSDPYLLSMSAQDQYLYVGYAGASEASQNYLPGLAPVFAWSLNKGLYSNFDQYYAVDLQAAPQSAATTAIALGPLPATLGAPFDYSPGGVAVFDNTQMRPITAGAWPQPGFGNVLAWGKTDATLLGANNQETAPFQDFVYNVDGDGVSLAQTVAADLSSGGGQIHSDFGTGLVYSDNGNVADPASGKIVATFNASGLVVPDSSLNRVFFLSQLQSQKSTNSFTLVSFDQTTYAQVSTIPLNNLAGVPFAMVRWGANGLAILTDINDGQGGMLYLISDAGFVTRAMHSPANGSAKAAPAQEFQLRWKPLSRQQILQRAQGRRATRITSAQ